MSLNWGDIEALRARVPRQFQPWDEALPPGYYRRPVETLGKEKPERESPFSSSDRESRREIKADAEAQPFSPEPGDTPANSEPAVSQSGQPEVSDRAEPMPLAEEPRRPANMPSPMAPFADPRAKAEESAKLDAPIREERERTELGFQSARMAHSGTPGNRRADGGWAYKLAQEQLHSQEKKQHEAEMALARKQAREALEARLRELDEEIAKIDERIKELDRQMEALAQLRVLRAKGMKLDADDPVQRELIRKAGLSANDVGRANEDPSYLDRQIDHRSEERNDNLRRKGEKEHERSDAQHQLQELDAGARSNDPEFTARLSAKLRSSDEADKTSRAMFQDKGDIAKAAVADAIAADATNKIETKRYVQQGLQDTTKLPSASAISFDLDAPPPFQNAPPLNEAFAEAADSSPAPNDRKATPTRLPAPTL